MDVQTHSGRISNPSGFTLIELLIVLGIVGILMSLVGPLAIDSLEKANARTELQSLKNWVKFLGNKAFITEQSLRIELNGSVVNVISSENTRYTRQFDTLFFNPQQLVIQRNGLVSPTSITASIGGRETRVEITTWDDTQDE